MPETPLRFAVLHHTGTAQAHYDLLIELSADAPLATWHCSQWPLPRQSKALRKPDHRRIYLDYQGPISGGRGEVRRVACGQCRLISSRPDEITVELNDRLRLKLQLETADHWSLTTSPTPG